MSDGTGREGRGGRGTVRGAVRGGALGARLGAGRSATARRTPFVVLVVTLLAGGLISLLMLNAALNRDSFKLDKLQDQTTHYTDQQQQLQQEVDGYSAPETLEKRARELGMVPGGDPAFLDPNGKVQGTPSPATAPPAPPPTTTPPPTTPPATPSGTATPAGTTGITSTAGTTGTSGTSGTSTAGTPTTPTPGR
ncbi:septum formation initiator family protein [Actinacidiphila sp. bgisy145]|uniref:septum formation initiator family protein n=1 Tax=Actinacidiphila sp. bgisy145 TaxID=3413792 RepID=UPI003EBEF5A8